MSGFYLMHRGWMKSAVFKDEPYTEREAWEWLISEATYDNQVVSIMNNPVRLTRGQVSHSVRFLAEKWQWSKSQVETYLNKLKKWDMIQTENRTGQSIITICNYSQYQSAQTENRTALGQEAGQRSDSDRTKNKEDNTDKEINTPLPPKGDDAHGEEGGPPPEKLVNGTLKTKELREEYTHDFKNEFWPMAVKKVSRDKAMKAYVKARERAAKDDIHSAWRAMNSLWLGKKDTDNWQFVPYPGTWLNEGRWLDEIPVSAQQSTAKPRATVDDLEQYFS